MDLAHVAGLHVGSVETSSPTEIKVLLDRDAPQDVAFNTGRPQGFPRLNGYVLIPNEGGAVVAAIARMTMEPAPPAASKERGYVPIPTSSRRLFVTPIGTLETRRSVDGQELFELRRGVVSYPAVGDAVLLATSGQLRAIVEASGEDRRVFIGNSRLALDTPVTIDPDKLFGRHIGVFGNTGSGKSCTVAGLIRWSVEAAAKEARSVAARFIILDPNGEYRECFKDLTPLIDVCVYSAEPKLGENELIVPAWMWNGQEWAGAVAASPGTQRPVLMQAIRHLRSSALVGGDARKPDNRLLIATQLRAFLDYIRGCRAEGVAALGAFIRFKAIHENLAGFENQLRLILETVVPENETNLYEALDAAIETSLAVRRARTSSYNGQERINQFQDADMSAVLGVLERLSKFLPDAAIVSGPSEDTPARFDPLALPEMISLIAGLQPGNLQQHIAGLDLRIRSFLSDQRITPIIAPDGGGPPFSTWLKGLFGADDGGKGQITVLDLSLVPSDVMTTIVSVLGRLVLETAQRHRRATGATLPTVLVLEEAHNFVQRQGPDMDESGASTRCHQIFEKIAKEGRKFGVGLLLSSQRPAELAPTSVAQCNSFILHRIVNDRDQELVCRLAPDSTGSLLKELPSLPTRKAILIGIATEIPLVFDVRPLPTAQRPNSAHPDFWDVWTQQRDLDLNLDGLASDWSD
jgi:uncharacterized protein